MKDLIEYMMLNKEDVSLEYKTKYTLINLSKQLNGMKKNWKKKSRNKKTRYKKLKMKTICKNQIINNQS